jgi:hypothetical protein
MNDNKYFYNFILENEKRNKKHQGYSEYGSRIIDILDLYFSLNSNEEKREFKKAIEYMLTSGKQDEIELAVAICTGFIDFRFKYISK